MLGQLIAIHSRLCSSLSSLSSSSHLFSCRSRVVRYTYLLFPSIFFAIPADAFRHSGAFSPVNSSSILILTDTSRKPLCKRCLERKIANLGQTGPLQNLRHVTKAADCCVASPKASLWHVNGSIEPADAIVYLVDGTLSWISLSLIMLSILLYDPQCSLLLREAKSKRLIRPQVENA